MDLWGPCSPHLVELRELLMPDEGLLARELPPAQETGQLGPVRHPAVLLLFLSPLFIAVRLPTVGGDQTLQRWGGKLERKKMVETTINIKQVERSA